MKNALIQFVEDQVKVKDFPQFKAGDTITVTYRIVEGNKERLQKFQGVVLQRASEGSHATFTVRKKKMIDYKESLKEKIVKANKELDNLSYKYKV